MIIYIEGGMALKKKAEKTRVDFHLVIVKDSTESKKSLVNTKIAATILNWVLKALFIFI